MMRESPDERFLSPEARALRPSVSATEELPDNSRRFTDDCPDENGRHAHRLVEMKGHIPAAHLRAQGCAEAPAADAGHRPGWLNLTYHPVILPRYRRLRPSDAFVRAGVPPGALSIFRGEIQIINDWPWCTVGKLFVGSGSDFRNAASVASGVMVGPNLMLTASHAVPWGDAEGWMRFVPAYRDGSGPFGGSYVRRCYGVRSADDNSDYVVCELHDPLGYTCGWMGYWGSTDDDFYEDRGWDSVGYPTDFMGGQRPCVEWNITPEDASDSDGEVEITFSSPFSSGGWSGGPLFGWVEGAPRVVGIMRGIKHIDLWIFGSDDDTLFTGGTHMVDLINYGLTNWPPGQPDWRFCHKCEVLFFDGFPSKGLCAAGGAHEAMGFNFVLPHDIPGPGQARWRFCRRCEAMFYNGFPSKGVCAGGGHEAAGFNFVLAHDTAGPGQSNWRFCHKCAAMFFDGFPGKGVCRTGGGHEAAGFNFLLNYTP